LASVALVQLLRLGERLDVRDALVAESLTYGLLQSGDEFRCWLERQPDRRHRESDEPPVRVERTGSEVVLELHRPDVRNAYDVPMRDALVDALTALHADSSVESIRLEGAGPTFCSGGDLSEFGATPDPVTGHFVRGTRNAGWWLAALGPKVTTRVQGACAGAGVELPAFGGRVIADPATTFMLPEVSMGLVPGAGGTASIPRRIGRHRTASLALLGTPVDALTGLEWGLVDEIQGGP
jgi:enoyl-CoA hydratase/carnithine racemase